MELSTNSLTWDTLKVLLAGKLSQKKIDFIFVEPSCKDVIPVNRFQKLKLKSGVHLFSSNAAVKYLMPPTNNAKEVNYFLDYEAVVLKPLFPYCNNHAGKSEAKLPNILNDKLNKLNKMLSNQQYLAGNEISAADVSIWTTIYPLATIEEYSKNLFLNKKALKNWFDKIHKSPEVVDFVKGHSSFFERLSMSVISSASYFPKDKISKTVPLQKMPNASTSDDKNQLKEPMPIVKGEIKLAKEAWLNVKQRVLPKKAVHPVLPVPGERNVLVTSALPYVNNVPHLGNIIGCVLSGDVFARYCRLRNYNTIHICGTDEYGTATETKALEEGLTPKQICDKYFEIHDKVYKWFNIKFDKFGRTTTPDQKEISQDLFLKLYKNGFILSDSVEQLLCENCDRYLADRFVEGTCPRCAYEDARGDQCDSCGHLINATELMKPRCKVCRNTPVLRYSQQLFLDLPKLEGELRTWMAESSNKWSHNSREISRAWINDGLKPRCITRDLKWGVPVPLEGYKNKVFYVWFDAPIGYMSITKQYTDQWKKWWVADEKTKVNLYQFMAKDNVPFHSILFPSSLMGSRDKYILVENIFATEYLNYEDGKFSKSRGVGVFGTDAQDTGIPADIWRFYLLYVRPETQDSNFSWQDLAAKNNFELLNTLGNFINRALVFTEKNYKSKVPAMDLIEEDFELVALVNRELNDYILSLERGKLREGIRCILSIARFGNIAMQNAKPWALLKGSQENQKRGATVIGLCINLTCLLSVLLYPYMPQTAETIQKQLNCGSSVNVIEDRFRPLLKPGHVIGKPSPLFTSIEESQINELKSRFCGRQQSKTPPKIKVRPIVPHDIVSLEAAVATQGNKVRELKSSGKDRSEWQPALDVLLDLKKKLEASKKTTPPVQNEGGEVNKLEKAIEEQGNVVRKLKESGVQRSQWQSELNKLLELKKKLAEIKGESTESAKSNRGKKNK